MKVAFFNSTRAWGGGEKWHLESSEAVSQLGYETVIFTGKNSGLYNRLTPGKQKVYTLNISNLSFLNPFKVLQVKKLFQREKPDAIIINLSADLKIAGFAASLAGVKRIIYRRGSAIPVKNSMLNRFIFKNIVTDILANSEETKKTILSNNKNLFPENKITVIYNGIDLNKYEKMNGNTSFRKPDDKFVIGNLGRLVKQKGQKYIIELAVLLKEKNLPVKFRIGGEGPLYKELSDLASEKNVTGMIEFSGFIDDVKSFMTSLDVFILTSLWEGFGYVIAEAMYFKKPVVAFNVSSNPELIEEGDTGFLVNMGDIRSFADKIEFLYHNRSVAEQMGEKGFNRIVRSFSFQKSIQNLNRFLTSDI